MKKIILIVALWLIIVNLLALAVLNRFNLNPDTAYLWIHPQEFHQTQSWNVVDLHNRWDSYWYLDIVNNGYYYRGDNTLSNVAFFPLYPALIKITGTILLQNYALAGWILSIVFLFLAVIYFYRLLKEFHPDIDPELPILLMLIFPTAFFFNIIYTESLFLFLTLACFFYSFRKQFWLAGLFGFLGALAHSNGVFLALPILWEIWRTFSFKKMWRWEILNVAFPPIAMASFFLFHYLKFHDLFLFFKVEGWWGRAFKLNMDHFQFFSHPAIVNFAIDVIFALLIVVVVYLVSRKISLLYGLFMLATVVSAITSGTLMSIGRYSLVLFPMFILLAKIKNRTWLLAWYFASILLLALDITLFVNNYWAG